MKQCQRKRPRHVDGLETYNRTGSQETGVRRRVERNEGSEIYRVYITTKRLKIEVGSEEWTYSLTVKLTTKP